MKTIMNYLLSKPAILGLSTALAPQSTAGDNIGSNLVNVAAGVGAGIIAAVLIVAIVKDVLAYAKGGGSNSVWKIVGKVAFLVICLGFVYVAVNYKKLAGAGEKLGNNALEHGNKVAGEIVK